ncbi:DUF4349 domain-containing protein [Guptibacillus hwajinpoensis]|uniref:DUF4349 domain-containing protein n=1 Tax=Guptibacillus hwajinpoensis TaxID=208199 RepID=UPI001CFC715D|nr:DUF4349 domain-containing protein [Pseudalkalibacillus hwajinpoensis]WLR61178.1 DUF4349 domain-containing protein [Pseudalkalibacillus hwajinpoensis]
MRRWILLICTSILLLAGCSSNNGNFLNESSDIATSTDQSTDENQGGNGREKEKNSSSIEKSETPALQQDRKVIFNANLSLTVEGLPKATAKIKDLTRTHKGYVVEESIASEEDSLFGSMTVRIPQPEFDSYLNAVEGLGKGAPQKSISGTDVTENYVDLTSRLKAKEAVQKRLESFLNEATKTEDLLAISNELSRVQEEVEQLKGQLNYLNNQSEYSTVTISLEQQKIIVPSIDKNEFQTLTEAKKLLMTTVNGLLSFFSTVAVLLIGLSPILAPLVLIGLFFLYRKRKKKNQKADQHT